MFATTGRTSGHKDNAGRVHLVNPTARRRLLQSCENNLEGGTPSNTEYRRGDEAVGMDGREPPECGNSESDPVQYKQTRVVVSLILLYPVAGFLVGTGRSPR